jgi:hypothetical protein
VLFAALPRPAESVAAGENLGRMVRSARDSDSCDIIANAQPDKSTVAGREMMTHNNPDLAKMHWRDRWEHEARLEAERMARLSERELLARIERGDLGLYYSIWRAIAAKGTVGDSAMVLWLFLQANPGEDRMLHRYHCAAALFKILGMPDPAVQSELRKRVQWDHEGEDARQAAMEELAVIIKRQVREGEAKC